MMRRSALSLFCLTACLFAGAAQAHEPAPGGLHIPEPLVFDLVRPLGAKKGELEVNALVSTPLRHKNRARANDPFGGAVTSRDKGHTEWAPEIEYAPFDDFAVEFELPSEGTTLEAYKLGLQWTLGTAWDNRYIDGLQLLVEPNRELEDWNTTMLYVGGLRFDPKWSALGMAGGRMNLSGNQRHKTYETLLNTSLFYDAADNLVFGLEINSAYRSANERSIVAIPQTHISLSEQMALQLGLSFGFENNAREIALIARPVFTW